MALATAFLTVGCQKEKEGLLRLTAEGMGGDNSKMYIDGSNATKAHWMDGDAVSINGTAHTVATSGSDATVTDVARADNYAIVFPAGIYRSQAGSNVTVHLPEVYHYRVDGSGRQVLDAPMAYYGDPDGGTAQLKHLTGSIAIQLKLSYNALENYIDSIIVSSVDGSGEAQYDLSGDFNIDLSSIGTYSGSNTTGGNNSVAMVFDQTELQITNSGTKTVQIPVPTTAAATHYKVRIVGHRSGNSATPKFVYEKTQATGGQLGRAVLAYIPPIDIKAEVNPDITAMAPFETETIGGTEYCLINNAIDFRIMCYSTKTYGSPYRSKNYRIANDIDMAGVTVMPLTAYVGTVDGGSHTVSNLRIASSDQHSGFIGTLSGGSTTVRNITFDGLTVNPQSSGTNYVGAICANVGSNQPLTIENVTVNDFRIDHSINLHYAIGAFVGSMYANVTIRNSSVDFADGQTINVEKSSLYANVYVGGIIGYRSGYNFTTENTTVNLNTLTVVHHSDDGDVYFGGVCGHGPTTNNTNTSTAVSGTVTVTGADGHVHTGKALGDNASASFAGVNTDALTINGE